MIFRIPILILFIGNAGVIVISGEDGDEVITIGSARQFGFHLEKDDGVGENESVLPADEITYTIRFYSLQDVNDVYIVDTLSPGVTYDAMNWQTMTMDPAYDPENHTYTWYIEHLSAYDPNAPGDPNEVLTLTVTVNNTADPMGVIVNKVEAIGPVYRYAEVRTPVGCYGGDVIYVDGSKPAGGNGTDWSKAYNDLQVALTRAGKGCGDEIWVAAGIYKPGTAATDTFAIPDGISVYGGFAGYETALSQRNWKINKTILSGYIDETNRNNKVVTMGDDCLLDGLIVEGGLDGLSAEDVSLIIKYCAIMNNIQRGIDCDNSNLTLQWCNIESNGNEGIIHEGLDAVLNIANCSIRDNRLDGISVIGSMAEIENSVIVRNGEDSTSVNRYYGFRFLNPSTYPVIHNNTIAHNISEAISFTGSNVPDIRNCIVWYNNNGGVQLRGYSTTHYSCVYDPNDPQGVNYTLYGDHNFSGKPGFAYDYESYGFYHLHQDSECRNAGDNTYVDPGETDMDDEPRIADGTVDVGADEVTCEDTSHEMDWSADGVVNFIELVRFSHAWMTYDPNNLLCDPNNPNYEHDPNSINYISQTDKERFDTVCDLDEDLDVDLDDLMIFADYWLWQACWREDFQQMQMAMMFGRSILQSESIFLAQESVSSLVTTEVPPKPIKQQAVELRNTIIFLERLWLEDDSIHREIDPTEWRRFMNEVYQSLIEIQNVENETNMKEIER